MAGKTPNFSYRASLLRYRISVCFVTGFVRQWFEENRWISHGDRWVKGSAAWWIGAWSRGDTLGGKGRRIATANVFGLFHMFFLFVYRWMNTIWIWRHGQEVQLLLNDFGHILWIGPKQFTPDSFTIANEWYAVGFMRIGFNPNPVTRLQGTALTLTVPSEMRLCLQSLLGTAPVPAAIHQLFQVSFASAPPHLSFSLCTNTLYDTHLDL